jgi:hypothetical protein
MIYRLFRQAQRAASPAPSGVGVQAVIINPDIIIVRDSSRIDKKAVALKHMTSNKVCLSQEKSDQWRLMLPYDGETKPDFIGQGGQPILDPTP